MYRMLVVRDIHYIKKDGKLYITNSSHNQLLSKLIDQLGKITVLAWIIEDSTITSKELFPLYQSPSLDVIEIPNRLSFKEKVKQIKIAVRDSESLSLKFCFTDSLIACHYANKYKKPYVIESGAYAFTSLWYHGGSIKYKIAAYPINWLSRFYHLKAKNIIYVSKHYLQERYPSKAIQVGCSDAILPDVSEEVLDRRLSRIKDNKSISLGLIGNTSVEYRGQDTLIEVMSVLRQRGFDVKVHYAGNPSGKVKRLKFANALNVEKYVNFDGFLNKEEIFEWIDNIDILVMPTLAETLGRAVLEAMSRGCPVIGSKESALPEQIGSDCIAPARDVQVIANIIEHMISDKEYMKLCAIENFWRAKKYNSTITDRVRRQFYKDFYERNGLNTI